MRRRLVAPLVLVAAAGLGFDPPPADAQAVRPAVPVAFPTADGVELKGLFHKSPNGAKQGDAVVVLLYPPGAEQTMLKGDWEPLIDKLTGEGFHVFRFDWRGHGESTTIVDPLGNGTDPLAGFWVNTITGTFHKSFVRGFGKNPAKADLRVKADIINPNPYFPVYVNDLAAVRLLLDQRNDLGDFNTESIYLIGAGDTATLGMLWLAAEWQRPAVHPALPGGLPYRVVPRDTVGVPVPPAGADIGGAVWLSASRPAAASIPQTALASWVRSSPRLRDENPMLFIYGAEDNTAKVDADTFYHQPSEGAFPSSICYSCLTL